MKQTLQLRLGQHLTMTPQLQQAIRLLQLSALDLSHEIQEALETNPLLDTDEEHRHNSQKESDESEAKSQSEDKATSQEGNDINNEKEIQTDSAQLTEASKRLVEQVIDDAKATSGARVVLTGHADKAGSDSYNDRLSGQRVTAVADALKKGGLPTAGLDWKAYGETRPAVETGDGVANSMNRRVEVEITR